MTPWTVDCQAPLSMEFSRQAYWSGLPFPTAGDPPDPGTEHASLTLAGGLLPLCHLGSTHVCMYICINSMVFPFFKVRHSFIDYLSLSAREAFSLGENQL